MEDSRISVKARFILGMADIRIAKHPKRVTATLIFRTTTLNQYNDPTTVETDRLQKTIVLRKNPDMSFVDMLEEELVEDSESTVS